MAWPEAPLPPDAEDIPDIPGMPAVPAMSIAELSPEATPGTAPAPVSWCMPATARRPAAGGTSGSSPAILARSAGDSPVGTRSGLQSSRAVQSVPASRPRPPLPGVSAPARSRSRCSALCAATIQALITPRPRRLPASSQVRARTAPNAPASTGGDTPAPPMPTCAAAASATHSAAKTTARSERIRSVITMALIVAPARSSPDRTLRYWPVPPRETMPGRIAPVRRHPSPGPGRRIPPSRSYDHRCDLTSSIAQSLNVHTPVPPVSSAQLQDEIVRHATPIIQFRRTLAVDHELGGPGGPLLWAGEKAVLFFGSANRDEEVFADPDAFDITRTPNPHLGFGGGGPHYCLGAHLARQEMKVLFRELFTRLPELRSVGEPDLVPSSFDHRVRTLRFTF
ncbi:cytochrome P450 [Kitasatospora aureofaciens]|nr:cytochrome P450 [Kitasatospora aureofaciens]